MIALRILLNTIIQTQFVTMICVYHYYPIGKHVFTKNCVRFDIPKIVNNCRNSILDKINTHSLQGFSGYLKTNYLQCYLENCTIMVRYVCKN